MQAVRAKKHLWAGGVAAIVGLEHHTPENIQEELMLYTPVPGTPLYSQMVSEGRLLADVNLAGVHGQDKFNFRHAAISREDSKRWLD